MSLPATPLTDAPLDERSAYLDGARNTMLVAALQGDTDTLIATVAHICDTRGPEPMYVALYTAAADLLTTVPGSDAAQRTTRLHELVGDLDGWPEGSTSVALFAYALSSGTGLDRLFEDGTELAVFTHATALAAICVALLDHQARQRTNTACAPAPLLLDLLNGRLDDNGDGQIDGPHDPVALVADAHTRHNLALLGLMAEHWGDVDGRLRMWPHLQH